MADRPYPRTVQYAGRILGANIREARIERGWTTQQLAERAGVTRGTVSKIEHGDLSVAMGTAFDCAVLVGVPLFYEDERQLAAAAERSQATLIRRPKRRLRVDDVDLDF